jgi:hypothetical protein
MFIPEKYPGRAAVLVATGPSLTEDVVLTLKKYKHLVITFACNDAFLRVPFMDEHYACDDKWWLIKGEEFRRRFPTLDSWSQCPNEDIRNTYNLRFTPGRHAPGVSLSRKLIHYGSNSGFQMLNLALLMGCTKLFLVGYNMQRIENKAHFFGDHVEGLTKRSPYPQFVKAYDTIQPEIKERVVNCTPNSALTMFKYMDLEEALQSLTND